MMEGDLLAGLLERRRVVRPVAGHRDDAAVGPAGPDDAQLVLGVGAREDRDPGAPRARWIGWQIRELNPSPAPCGRAQGR